MGIILRNESVTSSHLQNVGRWAMRAKLDFESCFQGGEIGERMVSILQVLGF